MTSVTYKRKNSLTPKEQRTTAAFKLMSRQIRTLEKSLARTQDELEKYRSKYHEVDKSNAVQISRNSTLIFHEFLKFVVSIVFGGIGVNLITGDSIILGVVLIVLGFLIYAIIVVSDRYKK
jgi:hypothetical protein